MFQGARSVYSRLDEQLRHNYAGWNTRNATCGRTVDSAVLCLAAIDRRRRFRSAQVKYCPVESINLSDITAILFARRSAHGTEAKRAEAERSCLLADRLMGPKPSVQKPRCQAAIKRSLDEYLICLPL
uniref:DUF982 domain-containing protein n=1 Tax=Steinernema glaseri TaxID=37863 RepID=A0A1I8AKJ0_9BILA